MNNTYRMENWGITTDENPYKAPECRIPRLCGNVYGNPKFEEGENITTSGIIKVETVDPVTKVVYTTSGSCYVLGEVDADYEELYPNAFDRVSIVGG